MDVHNPAQSATMTVDLDRAVFALSDALDFIGVDEIGHGHRVALMAGTCAKAAGWGEDERHDLILAGLLHDCGVSSTREHRHLVDELTWAGEGVHCERGAQYLRSVPPLAHLAPVVLLHHTPWAELIRAKIPEPVARAANLIYLVDRADAIHAQGVAEGKPLIEVLERFKGSHFSPDLFAVFDEQARREVFWFCQEDPTLREWVGDLLASGRPEILDMGDIKALASMFGRIIDAKSPYTERHSVGVAKAACRLGTQLGVSGLALDQLEVAALLHDLGKLRVPDELLEKTSGLTVDERRRMARHAFDTYEVLRRVFSDGPIAQWAAYHHEYVSGQGYPFHFGEDGLPLEARIIAVADVLQALAQRRPYKAPLSPPEVVSILDDMVAGGKLDAHVVATAKADWAEVWRLTLAGEDMIPPGQ